MTESERRGVARRLVLAGGLASALPAAAGPAAAATESAMYGLIGKMTATPGARAALAAILLDGVAGMPGCLSYIVAEDPADPDVLWITEAWESQEAHRASLSLPSVQAAIAQGRPLIAGMDTIAETKPLGGHGLA